MPFRTTKIKVGKRLSHSGHAHCTSLNVTPEELVSTRYNHRVVTFWEHILTKLLTFKRIIASPSFLRQKCFVQGLVAHCKRMASLAHSRDSSQLLSGVRTSSNDEENFGGYKEYFFSRLKAALVCLICGFWHRDLRGSFFSYSLR